ncbi:MAG: flagellar hook protein FlgE [Myxococcota bacterium]|nr:flagellar hook protein FlgE [Myxococcota bacterium]
MSLLNNLNTASSGLGVSSTSMSVIGDNIANINTVGYKGSETNFADLIPNQVGGLAGVSAIGTGAATNTVATVFGQGSLESSTNSLDMGISGSGFFMVGDGEETLYTRAGQFYLDEEGFITTASGLRLQGYTAEDAVVGITIGDLQISDSMLDPNMTTELNVEANLDSSSDFADTPIADGTFTTDGTGDTVDDFAAAGDFSTSMTVYDSLGEAHEVTMVFEKTADNEWNWHAIVDAGELSSGYDDGNAFEISSGTLSFDTDGHLTTFTQVNANDVGTPWVFAGAEQTDFEFNFGLNAAGEAVGGNMTQNASDSAVTSVSQDGYATGSITSVEVDTDGTIYGTYTNGQELALGQVVLADFSAPTELDRIGGTFFRATAASGAPAVGAAGTGGRGDIVGSALEGSNVELEDQFVNMITAQRTYQANSRVFSANSDLLQELVNLV